MSPLVVLLLAWAFSKSGGASPYIPPGGGAIPPTNLPPGSPVTGMATGQRYTITVLFTHSLSSDQFRASLVPNFTADTVDVLMNADGTWSGQSTGTYKGGTVASPLWSIQQIVTA